MDDVIYLYTKVSEWKGVDWIQLAQHTDRQRDLMNTPSCSTKADEIFYWKHEQIYV